MKCTQCDCKELAPIQITDFLHADYLGSHKSLEIYCCTKCGHLEFFNPALSEKIAQEKKIIAKAKSALTRIEKKQKTLTEQREKLISEKWERYQEEIKTIEKQSTNLDITLRQQQELKEQIKEIEKKKDQVRIEVRKIDDELGKLQKERERVEKMRHHELLKADLEYKGS